MRWIFFNLPNPSGRTMALGSTRPLTEMSEQIEQEISKSKVLHIDESLKIFKNKETWG
jgi:hypothetical protein